MPHRNDHLRTDSHWATRRDYEPPTLVVGENTEVRISIRNIGARAAGALSWEWRTGPAAAASVL